MLLNTYFFFLDLNVFYASGIIFCTSKWIEHFSDVFIWINFPSSKTYSLLYCVAYSLRYGLSSEERPVKMSIRNECSHSFEYFWIFYLYIKAASIFTCFLKNISTSFVILCIHILLPEKFFFFQLFFQSK